MHHKTWLRVAWILALLLLPQLGVSQGLTDAQYQALNTDITVTNQAEFATLVAAAHHAAIADAYNVVQSAFWVWRVQLPEKEIYEATAYDGSTWNWTTYIAQSVQERDGWAVMNRPGQINPSLPQVRGAYDKIFSGTGAAATQRAYLYAISKRQALRGEALFANTSLGNGQQATPATMTYIGSITRLDVYYALSGNRP